MVRRARDSDGEGHGGGIRRSLRALGHRDFAIFWSGAFLANFGGWFQSLAVPYVLFLLTDSALWVGLAAVGQFLPGMIFGPLGGVIAERYDLRRTLLVSQSVRALVALAFFLAWILGFREPIVLLLLAFVAGTAQGVQMPSWQAYVHQITPRGSLTSAVTLNAVQFNLARSFGPAVAGLVLLWWGPAIAFLVAFIAIVVVVVALLLVRHRPSPKPRVRVGVMREFAEALRYVPSQPGIVVALVVVTAVGLLGMPVFQHVIIFSESVFDIGALGLAILNLALGIGTIIAVPLVTGFEHRLRRATLAAWAMPLYGVALLGFAFAPTPILSFVALLFIGLLFLVSLTAGQNSIQMIVANRMRGRVMAVYVMAYAGAIAIGSNLQGLLTDLIGPRLTVAIAAGLLLVTAAVLILWRGRYSLRRIDDPFDE